MTPDTLRRAATLLRARAEKATPGPWRAFIPSTPGYMANVRFQGEHGPQQGIGYRISRDVDADYIAALHPAVALLLATWLEHEADRDEHQPWTDDVTEQALAFAIAYLGEEE